MKTGMKAPEGMGMVVATADIQNCRERHQEIRMMLGSELEKLKSQPGSVEGNLLQVTGVR